MNRRIRIAMVLCLLAGLGAWLFWPHAGRKNTVTRTSAGSSAATVAVKKTMLAGGKAVTTTAKVSTLSTNRAAFRLFNTAETIGKLRLNPHAILLQNAFIDTDKPLNFKIPTNLQAKAEPGAYIVQAKNDTDGRFRSLLLSMGGQIISYIPNNAYLVQLSATGASELLASGRAQAVLPYEPYYKLQPSLLGLAVNDEPLPSGMGLNLGIIGADSPATEQTLEDLGARIVSRDRSPFGSTLRVVAPANWTALAQSPLVQFVEPTRSRVFANDLSRVAVGITLDTLSPITNDWLGLSGKNVMVAVNDSGVDATHPDFSATGTAETGPSGPTRVFGNPGDLVDTDGHGTHVAGIIGGNGSKSYTLTMPPDSEPEGSLTNADFRGKAPLASIYSSDLNNSDYELQTNAAMIGALISNNSWDYGNGDAEYDLAAASYDAATRDAMPYSTGSQPVLFVFAAGNDGNGDDDGQEGSSDTILSPGTAKNVITVGALEQLRNITNWVTYDDGTSNQYWLPWTDSSDQVAWYSSRGNVGVGTEGTYGRFKPDLVSPGSFVVSTRSSQWDTNAYYDVTNNVGFYDASQEVTTNFLDYYPVSTPPNTVAVIITVISNSTSTVFPTNMLIYCEQAGYPDPVNNPSSIDITEVGNQVTIPPGANNCTIPNLQATGGFIIGIGDPTNMPIDFDLNVEVLVTNNIGNLEVVLEGMNDQMAPYYRYETGTSMSAADASGVLALIADYFTNNLTLTPSPALMKAVLINGTRSIAGYKPALTNAINFEGWGLDNIRDCIPAGGLTYQYNTPGSSFFVDQSPTNALATGESLTYMVNIATNTTAPDYRMTATLVWTDPPGDPVAAVKLVNNLVLVITNLTTGEVFYGNDISAATGFNQPWDTNTAPNIDTINNVQNILLPPGLGAQYSVTVLGRDVNVNAVTAQTNNELGQYAPDVVQDFALVISLGEGEVTNAFMVTPPTFASNPTGDQDITVVTTTNAPLFDQFAGESSPLMGTNTLNLGTNTIWGSSGMLTVGETNQWHFYIVTNSGPTPDYTNGAFITFDVSTLSIPRMGVEPFNGLGDANSTKPEADIDLYVSQDPSITNLNLITLSNTLAGVSPGFGVNDAGVSLSQGGTEFVFFTNSAPGQVYYVGVKSEDHEAAEYAFLPVFTDIPFSQSGGNGDQIVNGLLLPQTIPTGNNAHPGVTNIFALAIMPMTVEKVTVTNLDQHQNFGDLVGALKFGGQAAILNNHDHFGNTFGQPPIVYDDSPDRPLGTTNTDGPGSLLNFRGMSALGPWILGVLDDSAGGFTGQVSQLTLLIQPHRDLTGSGIIVSVPPGGWFIDYVDVPPGYTNLLFAGTNISSTVVQPAIQMYERDGNEPTLAQFDQEATLTNGLPPGNSISVGPPLPAGRYFIGLYNPNQTTSQNVFLVATLGINQGASDVFNYAASSGQTLPDDAVSSAIPGTSIISVPNTVTQQIASVSVGLVMDTPRLSDYTFTLISPTGQRVLLMENRGGNDTNGAGAAFVYTNILNSTASGGSGANTNYLSVNPNPVGTTVPITWNFYTVPDQMTVYDTTNPANFNSAFLLYDSGYTNNLLAGPGAQNTIPVTTNIFVPALVTNITIIMNQFGNSQAGSGDAWTYTAGQPITNYQYLVFTDDTNLANVPIKFAQPPFNFTESSTNYELSDFDFSTNGDYLGPTNIHDQFGGWSVPTNLVTYSTLLTNIAGTYTLVTVSNVTHLSNNLVSVVSDPSTALTGDVGGSNYLALAYGTITRAIPTTPGHIYNVTFWYRGPDIAGWWRGEGNALDSSDPENDNNNGTLIGRFDFPAGEVGQAFELEDPGNTYQFAGTNTYVQIPGSVSLNVGAGGGLTLEGWINPTNLTLPEPLFEWLSRVPTNTAITNIVIQQGPVLDPATGNYYYLLGPTNWTTSEMWAEQMGGHLVTLTTANLENWIYDTFTSYGTLNRDLWTGLQYTNTTGLFSWSSGFTNLTYTDWAPGQPFDCSSNAVEHYVAIMGPTNAYPGLWRLEDDLGQTCDKPPTNPIYGVVELTNLPPIGVQFWVSATNSYDPNVPVNTNAGSLFGVIAGSFVNGTGTNYGAIMVSTAPGLLTNNVYQHVALTFNTNSGLVKLYLNGTNVPVSVAFTNISGAPYSGPIPTNFIVPNTTGDLLLGHDMTHYTNNFFAGEMDEMSVYARALSDAEIKGIYTVSASTTNRLVGKFDPTITPAVGLSEALVTFGTESNIIYGLNDQWQVDSYTFTATSNSMPLTISGLEPGILLDEFGLQEAPETNLYYLPEQSLTPIVGDTAGGAWTLQVWDNRVGAYVTNVDQLLNWELTFVLASNAVVSASLLPQVPMTTTPPAGQTVYYAVPVPAWAHEATNILVSSSEPVNLTYFDPTNPPTGANAPDAVLLTGQTSGIGLPVLITNAVPPFNLLPGQTYYLGVQNTGGQLATVKLEVDYDIMQLTNGAPFSDVLSNEYSSVRYFSYDVGSNAYEATFQLLKLDGNADLVVSKGAPLPDLSSAEYASFNSSNADENIYVLTNSQPVVLTNGLWYMGVINRSTTNVHYSILAKELDAYAPPAMPVVINLTNDVPFTWTMGPGAALTNFFHFHATNSVVNGTNIILEGLRFEVYNANGDCELTVQTNALPLAPPFFQSSQNSLNYPQLVYVLTNNVMTNLAGDWYLGVPNREVTNINYTIVVGIQTNIYFPAFPGATGMGGGAVGAGHAGTISTVYHVTSLADSGPGTLRAAVGVTNRTVIFDVAGTIVLDSALVITNSYLTIAGQTSPGGITVAGSLTSLESVHDVIVRDVRFRSGGGASCPSQAASWFNSFEGSGSPATISAPNYFDGWQVVSGSVDWLNSATMAPADGSLFVGLDGTGTDEIATNIPTDLDATYVLTFAYAMNPTNKLNPTANVLLNGNTVGTVAPNPNYGWQATNIVFTATSPYTTLAFQSFGSPNASGVYLDYCSMRVQSEPVGAMLDSFQFVNASNVIADHISASWSSNNLVSVLNSSNVTVQWSIMADSLSYSNNPHATGSLLRGGAGLVSFNHNLYADNFTGSPRLGDNVTLDFVNNVIYNWGYRSGLSDGTNDLADLSPNGCTNQLNYVANYLIAGPDTSILSATNLLNPLTNNYDMTNIAFFGGVTNALAATWIFQTNNFIDSDTNGVLNGANTGWGMFTNDYTRFGRSFSVYPSPVDEAYLAYEEVMDFAGVDMSQRDAVDTNIVTKVRYQTGRVASASELVVPNIVAWWKGESNLLDSVGGNNAYAPSGIGFIPGEVGTALSFNGSDQIIIANPATPSSLDVGQGGGLTFEEWIYPQNVGSEQVLYEFTGPIDPQTGTAGISGMLLAIHGDSGGILYANLVDNKNNAHIFTSPGGLLKPNQWQHIAETYDKPSGIGTLYINGVDVTNANLGVFTPGTSFTNLVMGGRVLFGTILHPAVPFVGNLDEITLYNTALCANTIAAIYKAGHAGKFSGSPSSAQSYLDTDQDGLPNFWEATFTTNFLFVSSNNRDDFGQGYTDLEEYDNWLAVPHAVTTVTNPVAVDLYKMCGGSGHLAFLLTNGIHGTVYLTNVIGSITNTGPWSNSIAVFTPTNNAATNYFGYASFQFYVTNMDTSAYFGPETVSVIVSAVPILTNLPMSVITLTNGVPYDPCLDSGYSQTFEITIPTNTQAAVFELDTNSGPMALVLGYGQPPSLSSYDYYTNVDNSAGNLEIEVTTNSTPVPLTPGDWYLTAVNVNPAGEVCYSVLASFTNNILPPIFYYPTNTLVTNIIETVPWSLDCVAFDLNAPPLPLTYAVVSGPPGLTISNDVINWTPAEGQAPSTNNVQISVSNGVLGVTNSFTIVVLDSNLPPVLPEIPIIQFVSPPNMLVVSNMATNPNIPALPLSYTVTGMTVFGLGLGTNQPTIDTNGTITWAPTEAEAFSLYSFTTVVTDDDPWAINSQSLSATNMFYVFVIPQLYIGQPQTNILIPPNGTIWYAVQVPANAIQATNTLLYATLPINMWFSTNLPPGLDNELLANVTSGSSVLSTNLATAPTNILAGGYYFLGLQNPNNVAVTAGLEVTFDLAPSSLLSLPVIPDQYIGAGDTLVVTNTATDTNASAVLVYNLINPPPGATINSDGIITWAISPNMPPTNVVITTVVTDTGANVSVENSFNVFILPGVGPITNVVAPFSTNWFYVEVPPNADMATNILLFATGSLDLWFSTNEPPTITGPTDYELLTNSLAGQHVITTNSTPVLVPGSYYFLGVYNPNSYAVTNAVDWKFHLVLPAAFSIFSITETNIAGSNGFLVTWDASTNDQFHLQWTPTLVPSSWTNFNGVISFTSFIAATNSQFQYFDDGSQTGGFGPTRFYRLLLLNSPTNTAPFFLYSPVLFYANPSVPFVFTNSAKDWDIPAQTLTYSETNSLGATNVTIDPAKGTITWTPTLSQVGLTNFITTFVADNGVPQMSATNVFEVIVTTNSVSGAVISNISIVSNGVQFQWTAPAGEQFQVRWTTNLASPNWQTFPGTVTSATTNYMFVDTNMPLLLMKFYQLIVLP